jgi:hypothetical protein
MIAPLVRTYLVFSLLLAPATIAAQTKVVVVPVKGKGGAPLPPPQVKKLIETPLKAKAELVPFKEFQKAAKKAKVKPSRARSR